LRPVPNSLEFRRVLNLPRRSLDLEGRDLRDPRYVKKGSPLDLWPIQAAALEEAQLANGLFAPIGVGHGKTLISLLLPTALRSKKTVLLVPAQLKKQLAREIPQYVSNFQVNVDVLHVFSYNDLSRTTGSGTLGTIRPDLIIADEAHCLRNKDSARTKRFLRYMRSHPGTRFCALSGTMTTRSVMDYAHLLELALRKNSPLPQGWHELQDWSGALDVKPADPLAPGVLAQLGEGTAREAYRSRLIETEGVVATEDSALSNSLIVSTGFTTSQPLHLKDLIKKTKKEWRIFDEEIVEATHMGRVLSQLHSGFYYRWEWAGYNPTEWIERRRVWHSVLREYLRRGRQGLDSPALVAQAIEDGKLPQLDPFYRSWKEIEPEGNPEVATEWQSDYLLKVVDKWQQKNEGLIWYSHDSVGKLLERAGLPVYGIGRDASEATESVIACSLKSQGTGKNLQRYAKNLLLECPANGTLLEQVLGRTHRPGQESDEVVVDFVAHAHNRKAIKKCVEDAKYVQSTTGQRQKILYAQRIGW